MENSESVQSPTYVGKITFTYIHTHSNVHTYLLYNVYILTFISIHARLARLCILTRIYITEYECVCRCSVPLYMYVQVKYVCM